MSHQSVLITKSITLNTVMKPSLTSYHPFICKQEYRLPE